MSKLGRPPHRTAQSGAQTKGLSIRELERIRDDNLVGIVQALKGVQDGAGWAPTSF